MPTNEEIASSYGWALSVINSSSELKHIFAQAKSKHWTSARFIAEVRDTRWYRTHSENWRKMMVIRKADPGEFSARWKETYANLKDQARAMGSLPSYNQLKRMTTNVLMFGWNDAQIKNVMASWVRYNSGRMFGQAAVNATQLRAGALANGYAVTPSWIRSHIQQIARGDITVEDTLASIREQTARAFPSFANELRAGMDLKDIAAPYVQSMATLWEQNPAEITMFNPYIRKALSRKNPKDGTPWAMSTTDFEDLLRQSPRWLETDNARDAGMSVVHDLLRNWGVAAI